MTTAILILALASVGPEVASMPALHASPIHDGERAVAAFEPMEPDVASLRPPIVWKPIPYGDRRRRQMGAYSKRHYGDWKWRLTQPVAVVEHYTTGTTWQGAWNTFAANASHLGEYPGTCAHFIVHTDGTIYQLAPLWIRCRHTIGLNQLSIGIEHVGALRRRGDRQRPPDERFLEADALARGEVRDRRPAT